MRLSKSAVVVSAGQVDREIDPLPEVWDIGLAKVQLPGNNQVRQ